MKLRRLASFAAASAVIIGLLGQAATAMAVTKWATPDDWYASSPGDKSNEGAFWEEWFDLNEGDCWKIEGNDLGAIQNADGSASLGAAYGEVIVKQANPNAKDVTYDNTIFDNVAADETVFADTDGDGDYDADDSNGISHIIVCSPAETSTTTTSGGSSSSTTTTGESSSTTTTGESSSTTTTGESSSTTTTGESSSTTTTGESSSTTTTGESSSTTTTTTTSPTTTTTSFNQTVSGTTDTRATLPNTATIEIGGPSSPTSSIWMLIVALGLLLGSVVILTPAPSKTKR
jgi:hypothetical protein